MSVIPSKRSNKKQYKLYIHGALAVFFILTINIASGYLQDTTLSQNTQHNQTVQLATPEGAIGNISIIRKDMIRRSLFGISPVRVIVSPRYSKEGKQVRVGWDSIDMKRCEVYGPRGFYRQSLRGIVYTVPFVDKVYKKRSISAVYTLLCDTFSGKKIVREAITHLR